MPSEATTDDSAQASGTSPAPAAARAPPARDEPVSASRSARKEPAVRRESGAARKQVKGALDQVRNRVGSLVWIASVLCALVLVAAAALVALDANPTNDIVVWLKQRGAELDGPFGDLFTFDGKDSRKKSLLVNNGIAAVAYLAVGKVLERVIKA